MINDKIEELQEVDTSINLNAIEIDPLPEEPEEETKDSQPDHDFEDLPDADEPSISHA